MANAKTEWTSHNFVLVDYDVDEEGGIIEARKGFDHSHPVVVAAEAVLGGAATYLWVLVDPAGARAPRLELGNAACHLAWTVGSDLRRAVPSQDEATARAARDAFFACLHRKVEQIGGGEPTNAALKAAGLGGLVIEPRTGSTRWYETATAVAVDGRRSGFGRLTRALFGPEPKEAAETEAEAEAEVHKAWEAYAAYRETNEPWSAKPIAGEVAFITAAARHLAPLRSGRAAYMAAQAAKASKGKTKVGRDGRVAR